MLRSSLLKAGRLAAALGRQQVNHPSGSVVPGSQVRLSDLNTCKRCVRANRLLRAMQSVLRNFSTNSHDIFNVVRDLLYFDGLH